MSLELRCWVLESDTLRDSSPSVLSTSFMMLCFGLFVYSIEMIIALYLLHNVINFKWVDICTVLCLAYFYYYSVSDQICYWRQETSFLACIKLKNRLSSLSITPWFPWRIRTTALKKKKTLNYEINTKLVEGVYSFNIKHKKWEQKKSCLLKITQ